MSFPFFRLTTSCNGHLQDTYIISVVFIFICMWNLCFEFCVSSMNFFKLKISFFFIDHLLKLPSKTSSWLNNCNLTHYFYYNNGELHISIISYGTTLATYPVWISVRTTSCVWLESCEDSLSHSFFFYILIINKYETYHKMKVIKHITKWK